MLDIIVEGVIIFQAIPTIFKEIACGTGKDFWKICIQNDTRQCEYKGDPKDAQPW